MNHYSDINLPILSVSCLTYNHSDYIERTLEGFFLQETNFEFEIIICDDCSTDNTPQIINKYIFNHRKGYRIKYFRQEKNLGMMENGLFSLKKCSAKHIAICEGDDYWTDPYKLQKQINFLEDNPDFVICYHPVNVLFPDGTFKKDYGIDGFIEKTESDIFDLAVLGNYIHTPSVVFRNVLKEFPDSFKKSPIGDFFLWMLLAQHGKIKKLPEVMAVYRLGVGVHSTQSEKFRQSAFLKTLSLLSETMEEKTIVEIIKNRIAAIKSVSLPYPVRGLDDFGDLVKAENLKDYVGFGQLLKAILLKTRRRF